MVLYFLSFGSFSFRNMSGLSEPRMTGKILQIYLDDFFKSVISSKWCLEIFVKSKLEDHDPEISLNQLLTNFVDSLDQMNQLNLVPVSIRSFCTNYINWLRVIPATFLC